MKYDCQRAYFNALIKMNGGKYMYYVRDKELEDSDVILASCELCIDFLRCFRASR